EEQGTPGRIVKRIPVRVGIAVTVPAIAGKGILAHHIMGEENRGKPRIVLRGTVFHEETDGAIDEGIDIAFGRKYFRRSDLRGRFGVEKAVTARCEQEQSSCDIVEFTFHERKI